MTSFDAQITFAYVADLDRSTCFYRDVLGLELVLDQGGCRIFRGAGDAYLGFCVREDSPRPAGVVLTLVTDDVDSWHERLTAADVEVFKAPAENLEYGIYHLFAKDPDGYTVEIQRFLNPGWAS